jgi:hypothetical protein
LRHVGELGRAAALFAGATGDGGVSNDHDPQRRLGVLLQDLSGLLSIPYVKINYVMRA